MSRKRLEQLVMTESVRSAHLGLYSQMLGICGDDGSAMLLKKRLQEADHSTQVGDLIFGYLLLTRGSGVDTIRTSILENSRSSQYQIISALYAFNKLWLEVPGEVDREKLCEAIRALLNRDDSADLAIDSLRLMHDWSVQNRLAAMYSADGRQNKLVKEAITRYMEASKNDMSGETGKRTPH